MGRLPRTTFRGLNSVHMTLRPAYSPHRQAACCLEGFDGFVTSTAAPIATGWSDLCRVGIAPTEEPRLSTTHRHPPSGDQTPTLLSPFHGDTGGGSQSHVTRAPIRIPRLLESRCGPQGSTTARSNRARSRISPALCIASAAANPPIGHGDASSIAGGETGRRTDRPHVLPNCGSADYVRDYDNRSLM